MLFFTLIISVLYSYESRASSSCNLKPCTVYGHLSVNEKGLEKLFTLFSPEILKKSSESAKSKAQKYFESENFKKKLAQTLAKNATFPDFSSNSIGGLMKPAEFNVSKLVVDKLRLQPSSEVKCEKLICELEINIEEFSAQAQISGRFKESGQTIMPETTFNLSRNSDLSKSGRLKLTLKMDPKTGELNDLVSVNALQMQLDPSFLNLEMNNKSVVSNTDAHYRIEQTHLQEVAQVWQSFGSLEGKLVKITDPSLRAQTEKVLKQLSQKKTVDIKEYESVRTQLARFPELRDKQELAKLDYRAQSLGFADGATLGLMQALVAGVNLDLRDTRQQSKIQAISKVQQIQKVEEPIQTGLTAAVEQAFNENEVDLIEGLNEGLKDLDSDFNELTKQIPSLHAMDYSRLSNIEDLYSAKKKRLSLVEKDSHEYKKLIQDMLKLQKEFLILEEKIESDTTQMSVSMALRKINQANGGLSATTFAKSPEGCDKSTDFSSSLVDNDKDSAEISTELTPEGVNAYFESNFKNAKMDMCYGGTKEDCSDGRKITALEPPKVTCSTDGYKVDFKYKVGNAGEIQGHANAEFVLCEGGYPCLKIHGLDEGAKNSPSASSTGLLKLANTGGAVEQLIRNFHGRKFLTENTLKADTKPAVRFRPKLISAEKNPKNCNLKMDWQLVDTDSNKIP